MISTDLASLLHVQSENYLGYQWTVNQSAFGRRFKYYRWASVINQTITLYTLQTIDYIIRNRYRYIYIISQSLQLNKLQICVGDLSIANSLIFQTSTFLSYCLSPCDSSLILFSFLVWGLLYQFNSIPLNSDICVFNILTYINNNIILIG